MVYVSLKPEVASDAGEIAVAMENEGIRVGVINPRRLRLVTHYWIDDEAVARVISVFQKVLLH
jgi:threonine aldolase